MGEAPTHPELLDWLALEFVDRGWSIKQMHRLLMTSRGVQMSSQFEDAGNVAEGSREQVLMWRFRARRLEAETMRDSILAVSGGLNREIGGPAVFPASYSRKFSTQMTHGIWRNEEDGPEGLAAQRVYLSQAWVAVPDARVVRSAGSEHLLRRAGRFDRSHAGADADE